MLTKKQAAHDKAGKAVRSGKISRPDKCSACGKKCKPDGHHKDYDKPLELTWLCRQCHMREDGRLSVFVSTSMSLRGPLPPRNCSNCNASVTRTWSGLCHNCNEYQRRRGKKRPYSIDGRSEKTIKAHSALCKRCNRAANVVGNPIKGYCRSCYTVINRSPEKTKCRVRVAKPRKRNQGKLEL